MERVFEVLGRENDKPDRPDARAAPGTVREIRAGEGPGALVAVDTPAGRLKAGLARPAQ